MTTKGTEMFEKDQKVQILASSNGRRRDASPWSTGTVIKVGRKYVHVLDERYPHVTPGQFDMATGVENATYSGSARHIFTEETRAVYDRKEACRSGLIELRLHDVWNRVSSLEAKEAILKIAQADKGQ